MAFDGIVTKSICKELKNIIGYKVDKVYEPDQNTIILGLYKKSSKLNLLSCISAVNCRIHLTKHEYKNPSVAPNFCMLLRKHLIGFKIKDIYCKGLERVCFINFENLDNPDKPINKKLIIELMGKHGNIILTDSNEIVIDSIRHTSTFDNSLRDIYPTCKYIFPKSNKFSFLELAGADEFYDKIEPLLTNEISNKIKLLSTSEILSKPESLLLNKKNCLEGDFNFKICDFNIEKIVSNTFNGISSTFVESIINEYGDSNLSKDLILKIYYDILSIINSNSLEFKTIFVNDVKKDYFLKVSSIDNSEYLYPLSYYLDEFYYYKENNEIFKNYRNNILHLILLTLKKYEKRLLNIDAKLSECQNMDKFKLYGELITANLYKISNQNMSEIELENYYDNNNLIKIPLDKRFSANYNARKYFKKYNKLKNALEIVTVQKKETISDLNYLESIVYELESCTNLESVQEIYLEICESPLFADNVKNKFNKNSPSKKHNAKKQKRLTTNKQVSFNPLKFKFKGYTILVGRNNKENDYLTLKYASKSDIWFHTKDIHGSHVILRLENNKSASDDVLYEAAKLAVLHSRAKNSTNVPVDYCQVCYVRKPHGSKPGMVIYSDNKTIFVK